VPFGEHDILYLRKDKKQSMRGKKDKERVWMLFAPTLSVPRRCRGANHVHGEQSNSILVVGGSEEN